ncbi:Galactose oxidase/kelch, beta-propeller [Sesbania bispinosa]|nr:Galactose oxidase/kelch, beta-propeller [Sesbania bispinosa]
MVGNGNANGNCREEAVLPYDIIINVLQRVPVKSLIRFKCVAKDWAKLLETPYFIEQHLHHSSHNNLYLLLQCALPSPSILIGPDFKFHKPPQFTSPPGRIIGSCNGLLCLRHTEQPPMLSLWNPATRQVKHVPETLIDVKTNSYHVGFGFSPLVNDYKMLRISVFDEDQFLSPYEAMVNRAEVYSLTTGSWKEIDASNLQSLYLVTNPVTVNGAIFWHAISSYYGYGFVVSFDIGEEAFTLLEAPPPPSHAYSISLAVYNHKIAVIHHCMVIVGQVMSFSIDLWALEVEDTHPSGESWVKKYSVGPSSRILFPLNVWGDKIVFWKKLDECGGVKFVLSLFNLSNKELINVPAQKGEYYYYASFNYAESLVPLGGNIYHGQ